MAPEKRPDLFAERGYELVCLDIGADLIAVAREKLKQFPNVSFVEQAFEAWKPEGKFDLIISATAFHWVDPKVRYLKVSEVLESSGFLAVSRTSMCGRTKGSLQNPRICIINITFR